MDAKKPKTSEERRHFERFNLQCRLRYQVTLEGNLSDLNVGESKNISQGGVLLNTNWPLPLDSTISIEFDSTMLQDYVKLENLQNYVEVEKSAFDVIRVFGNVVRCNKVQDGSYDVGVQLLNKAL